MKVMHVIARFNVGGTATWLFNLSTQLELHGHESVLVVGNVPANEIQDSRLNSIKFRRIETFHKDFNILLDLQTLYKLVRIIRIENPDIVNTHTAKAGLIGRVAVLLQGQKRPALVHTIHGHLLYGYFSRFKVELIVIFERFLAHFTDVILFAGRQVMSDCLTRRIGTPEKSIAVRPGVKAPELISREAAEKSLQIEKTLRADRLRVGWLGRLAPIKRPDRVIALAKRIPDVDFIIGGDGELRAEIAEEVPPNCYLVGFVGPDIFWSACDLALLTSDNEAIPISLIEASMVGIPAIATNVGGVPEIVLNDQNGYCLGYDEDLFVKKIETLVSNESLRKRMSVFSKEFSQNNFSLANLYHEHIQAYKKALDIRGVDKF